MSYIAYYCKTEEVHIFNYCSKSKIIEYCDSIESDTLEDIKKQIIKLKLSDKNIEIINDVIYKVEEEINIKGLK